MIVSAHQPNFMPYLGFFDKMKKSDIFVIRDEVLFVKKEYHNRNKIRINSHDNQNNPKFKWISVPVIALNDYILHIKIKKDSREKNMLWNKKILHELKMNYLNAPYFNEFFSYFQEIFDNSDKDLLFLNMKIINFFKKMFDINAKIVFASDLGLKPGNYEKSDASNDLADICRALGATTYLSGNGGKEYLNLLAFEKQGIKVKFQEFEHPEYKQNYPNFIPNLSSIDALFCTGRFPENLTTQQMVVQRQPVI